MSILQQLRNTDLNITEAFVFLVIHEEAARSVYGKCYLSQQELADASQGISLSTLKRTLTSLEQKGFIEKGWGYREIIPLAQFEPDKNAGGNVVQSEIDAGYVEASQEAERTLNRLAEIGSKLAEVTQ